MLAFPRVVIPLWLLAIPAGAIYAHLQDIPARIALPVGAAFLLEATFFASIQRLRSWPLPALWASALAPYLVYSLPTGQFRLSNLLLLAALSAAVLAWFRLLGRWTALDYLFLALLAAAQIARLPRAPFLSPWLDLEVQALGQLLWFRLAIVVILAHRDTGRFAFGFWPTRPEWKTGLVEFLRFIPAGLLLAVTLDFARPQLAPGFWWKAPLTFFGILWVVALAEEFFFRGFLLDRLRQSLRPLLALALSSLAFGAVHLWFRDFPNWRFALLAALAGVFYARAYLAGPGIRAAMVTHALTVTVWRTLTTG